MNVQGFTVFRRTDLGSHSDYFGFLPKAKVGNYTENTDKFSNVEKISRKRMFF